MGGPGVTAISCAQHISDAVDKVRMIKDDAAGNLSAEIKSHIVDVLEQLAEAKLAAVEAREEINGLSAYAETRDNELEYIRQLRTSGTQHAAPIEVQQTHIAPQLAPAPSEDEQRAAHLIRMASFAAADEGFQNLDKFASWFVGGTAAAVGLIIANFDKVAPFLGSLNLRDALLKVVVALGLVGLAKFFGSLVTTMARGSAKVLEIRDSWSNKGLSFPSAEAFAAAHEASIPAPLRWFPKKFRERSDHPATQARMVMRFLMYAGLSTLLAVGLVLKVLAEIAISS